MVEHLHVRGGVPEDGIVETGTVWLWLGLPTVLLTRYRRTDRINPVLLSALCVVVAAREAEWHKQFTGESMLKISYHLAPGPFAEKAMAAIALLCVLCLLGYGLAKTVRFWREAGFRSSAGQILLIGLMLLIATKAIDRAPALVEWALSVDVPWVARRIAQALEEGLELSMAAVFLAATLCSPRDNSVPGNRRPPA